MSATWLWLAPFGLQAAAMAVDEAFFHRRRELPLWERVGHPLDTLTVMACLALAIWGDGLRAYVVASAVSCLFVTKDEWVHSRLCQPGEHWLHSLLFVLHPATLFLAGWFRWGDGAPAAARAFLPVQLALTAAFFAYQSVSGLLWRRAR